jgi:catechol 2,3-dioxygenase-like lactoylglutathione lyase family enzyme
MEVVGFRIMRYTRQFDAMLRFYRDLLEMRCIQNWKNPGVTGAVLTPGGSLGKALIEILDSKDRPYRKGKLPNIDLSLEVRDADAWEDRLRRQGVQIVEEIEDKPWGHRSFGIEDPDGLRVTLYQVIG